MINKTSTNTNMTPAPYVFIHCQLIAYKLLEVACLLLRLAITALRRRLYNPHDASPKKSPLAMTRTHSNPSIKGPRRNLDSPGVTSGACNDLCATCQSLVDKIRHPQWHKTLLHHESIDSLEESSRESCGLCIELLRYLRSNIMRNETSSWETLFPVRCESDTSAASWQSEFDLTFTADGLENFSLGFVFELVDTSKCTFVQSHRTHCRFRTNTPSQQELNMHRLQRQNLRKPTASSVIGSSNALKTTFLAIRMFLQTGPQHVCLISAP